MIVTFFKGDHSSVTNGLEYLEGGTKTRKVAPELLSGNPDITRELLKEASRFSKAYTYGCLGFEEENIPDNQKQALMQSFENTLMAGFDKDQYDIVWIEHRDKNRLELNFHIVNMELSTGKALTPYVHSRDVKRIDTWKCIANDKYGFTNPNDPRKARTFTFGNNSLPRRELMQQVDEYIFQRAADGELNNQKDIVDALNGIEGVTVTRNTKSSISFKAEGYEKPIRLKGEIYGKSYKGIENLEQEQERRLREFKEGRDRRIKSNLQELRERNQHISKIRREQYKKPTPTKPVNTNAVRDTPVSIRDDSRTLPSNGIRNPEVLPVQASSEAPRESERAVLPDKVTPNQNNNHNAKHSNQQSQSFADRASKFIQGLKNRIENIAKRIEQRISGAQELTKSLERRTSEARRTGDNYKSTQQNCIRLNKLLRDPTGIKVRLVWTDKDKADQQALLERQWAKGNFIDPNTGEMDWDAKEAYEVRKAEESRQNTEQTTPDLDPAIAHQTDEATEALRAKIDSKQRAESKPRVPLSDEPDRIKF